jgi:glutamine amidotransferase
VIAIVDTGGANIASICNAFKRLEAECIVSTDLKVIEQASHLVLPGVGHAQFAMKRIRELKLIDFLTSTSQPILGICLGMQMFFEYLEEGLTSGLEIIPGKVTKLNPEELQVPNMGWSPLKVLQPSVLLSGLASDASFYFVHSYFAIANGATVAVSAHANQISAVVEHQNFYGTQFHPEKSGHSGAQVLRNFLNTAKG